MMIGIKFNSQNNLLRGDIHKPKHFNGKSILFIHGWSSTREKDNEYSRELAKLGYLCMTFEMAGHGESTGDKSLISRKEFLNNAIDAYDYLANLELVNKTKISVISSSFGCYLASILTSKRKVKDLVLRVPQNYPNKKFDLPKVASDGSKLKEWRKLKKKSSETYSLQALHEYQGEVLLIESEFDEYVSKQTIENYKNAVNSARLTYKYMQDTNHSLKTNKEKSDFVEILREWFISQKE